MNELYCNKLVYSYEGTHKKHHPTFQTLAQAANSHTLNTTATKTQTPLSPVPPGLVKTKPNPVTPNTSHPAPSQKQNTWTTNIRTHRNNSPGPPTSITVTLAFSQHTHMQHKQQYMHVSHHTHNIGYHDNLTDRPWSTNTTQAHRPSSKSERNLIILQVNIN